MQIDHKLIRLAGRLRTFYQQFAADAEEERRVDKAQLRHRFELVQNAYEVVEKAESRGWCLAATRHREQLSATLLGFQQAIGKMRGRLQENAPPVPSLRDLHDDLRHLYDEFDGVAFDLRQKFVAVQTGAITLENSDLGSFQVRLYWPRLAKRQDADCFEIIALNPRSAASNDNITHPHVKDRQLCAGDAAVPLQRSLQQGRLVDAFCLIRSVLETYNPQSAYCRLEDWEGISCWSCGYQTNEDDRCYCDGCEHDVCGDCTLSCKHCDWVYCSGCQTRCEVCNEPCCRRCLKTSACSELSCCADCLKACAACEEKVASSEIDEATDLCPSCLENADDDDEIVEDSVTLISSP